MTSPAAANTDAEVESVYREIMALDPDGSRISKVFRSTFDQLYDGQRTGRYSVEQLFKTEKTHFGTLIEINLQRELMFSDGRLLDFLIAGVEVDCKYSHSGAWMLPIESFENVVLVCQADDFAATWSLGLVRVTKENRRMSENRDRKTGLNSLGRERIKWLFREAPMPPNALLQLSESDVSAIMAEKSGQSRLNELFRRAANRKLTRNTIATVAQQADYMKRVRDNGGSRGHLRPEGYLILSGDFELQRNLAVGLGAEVPDRGELVSVRVVPTSAETGLSIDNGFWRLVRDGDQVVLPAPLLPR